MGFLLTITGVYGRYNYESIGFRNQLTPGGHHFVDEYVIVFFSNPHLNDVLMFNLRPVARGNVKTCFKFQRLNEMAPE